MIVGGRREADNGESTSLETGSFWYLLLKQRQFLCERERASHGAVEEESRWQGFFFFCN